MFFMQLIAFFFAAATFGSVMSAPMPLAKARADTAVILPRDSNLETVNAYKRQAVNLAPVSTATKSNGGAITLFPRDLEENVAQSAEAVLSPFEKRQMKFHGKRQAVNTIPAQLATKSEKGVLELFVKRDEVVQASVEARGEPPIPEGLRKRSGPSRLAAQVVEA